MKRIHQILLTAALMAVFLTVLAPASLLGEVLQQASGGTWQLADASGTLWNGQGVLTGRRDNKGKEAQPAAALPRLGWKLGGFQAAGLAFDLTAGGQPAGKVQVGWSGWQAQLRAVAVEARDITPLLPGLLNKGEWQGLLNLRQLAAQGNWRVARVSQIDLQWSNAGTSLMPKGTLGSFAINAHSEDVGVSFSISSQDGPLVLSGHGTHTARQGLQFNGELTDNAGLASQFPGFLGAYLQPTGEPRRYTVRISQLNL